MNINSPTCPSSTTFITEPSWYFSFSVNLKSTEHVYPINSKVNHQEKQLENKLKNFVLSLPPQGLPVLMICSVVSLSCSWIAALKTSIKKWLPLDQAIQEFMSRPLEETRM
jgi:hypothetical protein